MKRSGTNKWAILSIILAAALCLASTGYFMALAQNSKLRQEAASHLNAEWYQLYRLSELVDKNFVQRNFSNGTKYQLYVNQACNHFSSGVTPSELSADMRRLLVEAYDPLFTDLSLEKDTLNRDKASEILKDMNDTLFSVAKSIVDMQDRQKEKLLDSNSPEYLVLTKQVKAAAEKYVKLVDDYFKR